MKKRLEAWVAVPRTRCTCVDNERTCEEHKFTRADYDRLLAEVKRQRPVVRAAVNLVRSCGYGDRYGDHAGIIRAVERMQKGRKR